MDLSKFMGRFRDAVADHRRALEGLLVRLAEDPAGTDARPEVMRRFHTLKGESRMMGFEGIAELCHASEDLLKATEKGDTPSDLLIEVLDAWGRLLEEGPEARDAALLERVREATNPERAAQRKAQEDQDRLRNRFLGQFRQQAAERVQSLNAAFLHLDRHPDDAAAVRDLLREVHTLKGESRMMGFPDLATLTHRLEDVLKMLREEDRFGGLGGLGDLLFEVADALGSLAESHTTGRPVEVDAEALGASLQESLSGKALKQAPAPAPPPASAPPPAAPPPRAGSGSRGLGGTVRLSVEKLERLAGITGDLLVNHSAAELRVDELRALVKQVQSMERELRKAEGANGTQERLEEVARLSRGLRALLKKEKADVLQTSLALAELKGRVQEVRMMPLSTVLDFYPRIVRDMAREMGKEVRLELEGRETELDRRVLEEIQDPLVHLVRNSLDHGIETPAEREKAGKPPGGRLRIAARPSGDRILIEIEDDGRGMDPELVRRTAVAKGVITEEEAGRLEDAESLDLIWRAGFSTREVVTEISGRGVGTDVVRRSLDALGGTVAVRSESGKGTCFTLSVPLTMALVRVLLVRAAGQALAFPSRRVEDVVRAEVREDASGDGSGRMIRREGEDLPIRDLGRVLKLTAAETWGAPATVVLSVAGQMIGLTVEEILGEREVVVKGLGPYLGRLPAVSGASVLGDGSVALVLNPDRLLEEAEERVTDRPAPVRQSVAPSESQVLVVDDSIVIREMMRGILEGAGYQVGLAVDGQDALRRLRSERFDLVVSDIQMPHLDGFGLSRAIRADDQLARLPIVILTTLEDNDKRKAGMAAGANAYLVKKELKPGQLLTTIHDLLARSGPGSGESPAAV